MESFDVSLFEVGFQKLVDTLAEYGVDLAWKEKERGRVMQAWTKWQQLDQTQYNEIAHLIL